MLDLVWSSRADDDLFKITEYIAQEDINAAIFIYEKVINASSGLIDNPKIGRAGRIKGTRERVVTNTSYIIVYRVSDSIEILKIIHGARQYP